MALYRDRLPQLEGGMFLTDGGVETTLYFHDGIEFPYMAAFDLLKNDAQRAVLRKRVADYARVAVDNRVGLVLETITWRASSDWGDKLGYSADELAAANRAAVELNEGIREEFATAETPIVISGNLGPRGDGYSPGEQMSADQARQYHSAQIETLRGTNVDMCSALTLNYVDEAIGIVDAARAAGLPVAISFTVETDGRLPSGQGLGQAIEAVDAATGAAPIYYMINCAHPTHFEGALDEAAGWAKRLRALRANSSAKSHEELDESPELDEGDPAELGQQYAALRRRLPQLTILGGCCGTDDRHVRAIAEACSATF